MVRLDGQDMEVAEERNSCRHLLAVWLNDISVSSKIATKLDQRKTLWKTIKVGRADPPTTQRLYGHLNASYIGEQFAKQLVIVDHDNILLYLACYYDDNNKDLKN